ncbi:MAG: DUF4389 domain-containing protein [Gammaproteobacteria bacterium]|nr:DUF4389 domain-containing protein [Gammaproteobacteria bacterium]
MATKENLKNKASWTRGLGILLFAILFSLAEFVLWAIVLFQFGSQLISGQPNDRLLRFSRGLNAYIYQILQFVTYRSDVMPYPFARWPEEGLGDEKEMEEPELVEVTPPIEETGDENR